MMAAVVLNNRRGQPLERPALSAALDARRRPTRAAPMMAAAVLKSAALRPLVVALAATWWVAVPAAAQPAACPRQDERSEAQSARRTVRQPRPAGEPRLIEIGGFVHVGRLSLAATRSFDAILGSSSGPVVGGGGEVTLRRGLLRGVFARVDVSRFEETGQRVFVFEGRVFPLGIPETITLTPIEVTAGYRLQLSTGKPLPGRRPQPYRIAPYAGIGVGSLSYRETSSPSEPGDDVDERFTSYHVLGGADVRVWRWIGVGVEGGYRWVPDALGTSGVSEAFNETNLNGATIRLRIRAAF
jgi:hypothetical protein